MSGATRSALLACLLGLGLLYVAVLQAGLIPATGIAASGLVLFGLGVVTGHGGTVVTGLGALVFGTALGLGVDGTDSRLLVVIGVAGPVALVLADSSWWLRREAEVELDVVHRLVGALVPGLVVGALLAFAVLGLASATTSPVWLLPVAVVLLAAGIGATGEIVRRRRPRLGLDPSRR